MESSSINTLTGVSEKRPKKDAGSAGGNADAFETAMGEAGAAEADGKKADLIERDAKESDRARDAEPKEQGKDGKKAEGRVSDYVKNLQSKDPATLSMVEKGAFRVGEFAGGNQKMAGSPASGLAQMLASQGIDVTGFSPEQIKGLMSRMDTKDLGKMLSSLKVEPGAGSTLAQDEKQLKELKEKLVQAAQNTPVEQQAFNLEQLVSAGTSKDAGEAARAEQRRQIMDQILAQIDVRNVANQTEMNLRLNPEYLGEVKISLVHDDEGGVKALFKTTSRATREVLDENSSELIDQARGKGVRIGSMAVQLVDDIEAT
jgi:flagellar hook-length control protein FliK